MITMARENKRLDGMRRNPGDWRIKDIEAVCRAEGIRFSPPKRGGHFKVSHPSRVEILTIPAKRPIRAIYIRRLIAFVERVRESTDGH